MGRGRETIYPQNYSPEVGVSMSDLLDSCQEYLFEGKCYQVAPRDIYIERQMSLWVMTEAALSLDRMKDGIPPRFYREQMEIFNSKVIGKMFDWGRVECYNASTSDEGEKQLLFLKLKRGEAKSGAFVTRDVIDRVKLDKGKWNDLLAILYQQDYPEQYADFLQLIGREPDRSKERKEQEQKENQQSVGTPTPTGNTPQPTQS